MRVGKKIFPYPVVNRDISYSTFHKTVFKLNENIDFLEENNMLIIKDISYYLDDSYLQGLVEKGFITVYCVVECSYTVFRKKFVIGMEPTTIKIDISNLKDTVVISAFGVASKDIKGFNTADFSENYLGYEFNIEKNNILLIDDGYSIKIEYDDREDDKIASIFNIIKIMKDTKTINISSNNKKIFIDLPEKQFNIYETLSRLKSTQRIFFSLLLIPALHKELIEIQYHAKMNDSFYQDIDDIVREKYWFSSIVNRYKEVYSKEINLDDFKELNLFEFSQKLIDEPITDSIDKIYDLFYTKEDDNSE